MIVSGTPALELSEWVAAAGPALIWRPVFSPPQIVAAAAALLGITLFAYCRTWRSRPMASAMLLFMRLALLAGLVVLLMGPSDTRGANELTERTDLVVVLDVSESMLTRDGQGETRLEMVGESWLSQPLRDRLRQNCNPRLFGLGEQLRPLSLDNLPDMKTLAMPGSGTYLAQNLMAALAEPRGSHPAALLVLSDGHDTQDADPQPVASLARARNIPIHTVTFGSANSQQDLALLTVPMQEYLLPGEPGAILVKAYQFGLPDAETVLHLRHGNDDRQIPISFQGRPVVELQLDIRQDRPGQYEYQLLLDPVPSEVEPKNNRQSVFCQVQQRGIKVMLLEGQPYWDTKFLAQSLRKDERIEFTQITQVSAEKRETLVSRSGQASARVPNTSEAWSQYDVVVVGSDLQKLMNGDVAGQLNDFVLQHGGHVILARGQGYDPHDEGGQQLAAALSTIEPVIWDETVWRDVTLRLTPGAVASSWLSPPKMGTDPAEALDQLPGLESVRGVRRLKPATRVLVEAVTRGPNGTAHPAIVVMPVGNGQVVALLGHDAWRWSLRPPTDESLIGFYDTFWSNLIRWLVMGGEFQPGQQATLQLSRQSLQLAEPVDVEVVFKKAAVAQDRWHLLWTGPDGQEQRVSLRQVPGRSPRFRTTLTPQLAGVHQFQLVTPLLSPAEQLQKLNVFDVNLERLETSARPEWLKELAEASGGRSFSSTDAPDELLRMIQHQQLARQIPSEPRYLWDQAGIMTLLLTWIGCEWLLRRLAGLW
jgi:hypothetical protein